MCDNIIYEGENLKQIKLIATDLDHTLLTEKGSLPPNFFNLIRRLHDQKIHFVAASGRALYTLQPMFESVCDDLSLVAENGAIIAQNKKIMFSQYISQTDYINLIHYTRKKGLGIPILCAKNTAYTTIEGGRYKSILDKFFKSLHFVSDLAMLNVDVAKYTVFFPNQETDAVFESDYKIPLSKKFTVTIGGPYFLDIMHLSVNKGQALKILARKLNVLPSQMLTFGDNLNDIEMLQLADYSYVIKNAKKELDQYVTGRIGSNDDFAVVKTIQRLFNIEEDIV